MLHTFAFVCTTNQNSRKILSQQHQSSKNQSATGTPRARILIIDDDAAIRRTLALLLAGAGYLVDTAQNGEEAIAKSNVNFYNIALIDFRLPDMAGTKLLSLLRDTVPKMMKIMLTGFPMLNNAVDAINRGVNGYLTKPVDTERLLETVKELCEKQQDEQKFTEERVVDYVNSRFRLARTVRRENEAK
jgi:DNA-binding NtrC family response regulator